MGDMLQVVFGTDDGKTTVSGARWAVLVSVIATAIGTSMVTRKRALNGQDPVLGILF